MTINVTAPLAPPNLRRLDGTPITPTCEIPIKSCGCLAGDLCDCLIPGEFGDWFAGTIHIAAVPR